MYRGKTRHGLLEDHRYNPPADAARLGPIGIQFDHIHHAVAVAVQQHLARRCTPGLGHYAHYCLGRNALAAAALPDYAQRLLQAHGVAHIVHSLEHTLVQKEMGLDVSNF